MLSVIPTKWKFETFSVETFHFKSRFRHTVVGNGHVPHQKPSAPRTLEHFAASKPAPAALTRENSIDDEWSAPLS